MISIGKATNAPVVGNREKLVFILGPCVIESQQHTLELAGRIAAIAKDLDISWVFKASFDKANRTSKSGFRGPGIEKGLSILAKVREKYDVPIISDVHNPQQSLQAGEVLDILQIPAFLCRQTDLLESAGKAAKPVMIKKGQFLAPEDMKFAAEKVAHQNVILCERGTCFGYRDLIVDFRSFQKMRELGYPVIFDATHSVQSMGGAGGSSSGDGRLVPGLARAAVAAGVDGVFLETHEDPARSPSDGPNMIPLAQLSKLLIQLTEIHRIGITPDENC